MNIEHNLFQTDAERDLEVARAERRRVRLNTVVYVHDWRERRETDPCEAGTVGCSVNHNASGFDVNCESW
jgi:hypothetical protein